jgi:Spy/CpxP family protein refolding chaperone
MRPFSRLAPILLAGALSLALSGGALAQKGAARGPAVASPVLLKRLNLNADQQAKANAAADAYKAEQEKANALQAKEKRQALKAARDKYQADLNAALTSEQQKQLQEWQAEALQYGEVGPVLVGMNLSDEQKGKIKEINAKYDPQVQKLRADMKSASDKTALKAQIADANKQRMGEIRALLTPDQQKQLPTARKGKKNKPQ